MTRTTVAVPIHVPAPMHAARAGLDIRALFTALETPTAHDAAVLPFASITAPWTDEPVLALHRGTPVLFTPETRDPQRGPDGRPVIPGPQLRELERLVRAGVRMERIAVLHELDRHGAVAQIMSVLRDGPVTCSDDVARAVAGPVPVHSGTARAVHAFDLVAGGTARAIRATAVTAGQALDPIVFGVRAPDGLRHGAPALYYPLTWWRW
jgi:hypothetical protein